MTHISSANYWYSVAYGASHAWYYLTYGMSNYTTFAITWLRARPVTKSKIMEIEELYGAYRVCRKHNRRSRDMALFEMSLYGRLVSLCDAVNSRTYTPSANYTFIHYRPKPREVFAAEPELKILMCYVDMRINRLVDKNLIPRVFNNRVGKGTHAAVNQVIEDIYECSKGFTNNDCWIIKYDLKGYFPNLNQDRAYSLVSELITKELPESEADEMLYLVDAIVADYEVSE